MSPNFALVAMLLSMSVVFAVDPFAPPLVFGLCLRAGLIDDPALLVPEFSGFASAEFIVASGALYAGHALADKVPPVAHLMDLVGVVLKPLAVVLLGFWFSEAIGSHHAVHWLSLATILAGGLPTVAAVQTVRIKARLTLSQASLGVGLPFVSGAENVIGLGLAYLAAVHPGLALLLILLVGLPVLWLCWHLMRSLSRGARRLARAGRPGRPGRPSGGA